MGAAEEEQDAVEGQEEVEVEEARLEPRSEGVSLRLR